MLPFRADRVSLTMPRSTTNTTLSGGLCGLYGAAAASVLRSCNDCLTFAVTSEPQVPFSFSLALLPRRTTWLHELAHAI